MSWEKYQEEMFSQEKLEVDGIFVTEASSIASRSMFTETTELVLKWIGKRRILLDIGANDGGIAERFRKEENLVVAMDFPKVIRNAKKYPELLLIAGEATHLPLRDRSIDTIFMGELIEHVINAKSLLSECRRALVDDGELLATTPNIASARNRLLLLFGRYWRPPWATDVDAHIHFFTHKTISEYLRFNGFSVKEISGYGLSIPKMRFLDEFWKVFPKTLRLNIILRARKRSESESADI